MVYAVFVISSVIIIFMMYKTGHIIKSVLLSTLQGVSALFAVNFIGGFLCIHLPLNAFSVVSSAVGGLPGVIFLLVYDLFVKCF